MMEASMVTFQIQAHTLDQVRGIWQEDLKGAVEIAGFQGGLLLIDPVSGMGCSLGFWDSQDAAHAFGETEMYRTFIGRLMPNLVNRPVRQVFRGAGAARHRA